MSRGPYARLLVALNFALIIVMGTFFPLTELAEQASAAGGPIWNVVCL